MCHGNPGVVLVPRVGVGQERGRGVAVMVTGAITRVGLLIPVGTAAPYRWVVVAVPKAAPARRGSIRAARAVMPWVLGLQLPAGVGGSGEVHFVLRVMLAPVLLSSSSTVGLASGVLPIWVRGPQGVGLLFGHRPGYLPSPSNAMPGQLHTLVVIDGLDAHDGELCRVIKLRVRDGREPRPELVAEDAAPPRVPWKTPGSPLFGGCTPFSWQPLPLDWQLPHRRARRRDCA